MEAYAGRLVEWAQKTAKFVLDIVCKPKGQIGFSVLPWLDRGAHLRLAGQLPSPGSGLRDQSSHERGLDQNRHDPPHATKTRLSILRQVLRELTPFAWRLGVGLPPKAHLCAGCRAGARLTLRLRASHRHALNLL
jgi:hypothetical protein